MKFLNEADRPLRGREIFDGIQYDNYNSFRVLLSRYSGKKYNYIEKLKLNDSPNFIYKISNIGRQHALNPFLYRDKYKARQARDREMFLSEILNNPDKLKYFFGNMGDVQVQTVFDTIKEYVDSNSSLRDFADEDDNHQSTDDEIDYEEKYFESLDQIKKLQSQNFNLQVRLKQRPVETPKAPKTKLPSTSKGKRYNYLCSWEGKNLTSSFFENEIIPYDVLIKTAEKNAISSWKKKLNFESGENIDIFARTISSTLLKEHLYRKATFEEIREAGFYLVKNRGIRIMSKKYSSINKVVLKQSDIPNNVTSSNNAPQVKKPNILR
ncbi:hypothetical protein CUN85_06315 [Methanolobus halotolerans]|uniref:Uncharacterized protein n=1 Tax=Methanolobus halotolerans TaxID=2052935 RepID=A0A4E0QZU3_9EURY|nr:hypothetical protein CUN85_06315 [Methanolobus halotolerans]